MVKSNLALVTCQGHTVCPFRNMHITHWYWTSLIYDHILSVKCPPNITAVTFDAHTIRLNSHQMSTLPRTKSVLSDTKFVAQIKLRWHQFTNSPPDRIDSNWLRPICSRHHPHLGKGNENFVPFWAHTSWSYTNNRAFKFYGWFCWSKTG